MRLIDADELENEVIRSNELQTWRKSLWMQLICRLQKHKKDGKMAGGKRDAD